MQRQHQTLVLAGELDVYTAPELREAGDEVLADGDLVLDVKDLSFVDSRGLGALLVLCKDAASRDRALTIRGANGYVLQTLELAGLRSLLEKA